MEVYQSLNSLRLNNEIADYLIRRMRKAALSLVTARKPIYGAQPF